MADDHFNVDDVLNNIKNKLQKRDVPSQGAADIEILELTEVVNDFGETVGDLSTKNNVSGSILAEEVVKEVSLHLDHLVEKVEEKVEVDKIKIEAMVKQEIKMFIAEWMNKNLPTIVKQEVAREVGELVKKYKT